jgi:cytoskeletal protein RodZ
MRNKEEMKINRNNYESYFIDYLEGNLDESLVDDFIEFLTSNPDLKEELSMFEPVSVEPENIVFGRKELLLKEELDLETEFNHAAVANMEGDLSDPEKAAFDKYIAAHPEKKEELALFSQTKLVPDESIVFSKKNRLYKKTRVKTITMWGSRVAAVLVLAISVYLFIQNNQSKNPINQEVATVEEKQPGNTTPILPENIHEQQNTQLADVKPVSRIKAERQNTPEINMAGKPTEIQEIQNTAGEPEMSRQPEETFAMINPIMASIEHHQPDLKLETIYITIPDYTEEERLLVDRVIEKTGIEKLSLNKIAKAGLNLVTSISKEKFTYQTDKQGNVTEVNFDSRLLAFSIPTTSTRSNEDLGE